MKAELEKIHLANNEALANSAKRIKQLEADNASKQQQLEQLKKNLTEKLNQERDARVKAEKQLVELKNALAEQESLTKNAIENAVKKAKKQWD